MKQAYIDAKVFNKMIRQLRKAVNPSSPRIPSRFIHLTVFQGQIKCVAVDGYRVHEVFIPARVEEEFTCHIHVPRLLASSMVRLSLEDGVAYVAFEDVSFSTNQYDGELNPPNMDTIRNMIKSDERFEVAVRPQYLIEAASAMKGEKVVILNIGKNPINPVVLRSETMAKNQQYFGILPIRSLDVNRERE